MTKSQRFACVIQSPLQLINSLELSLSLNLKLDQVDVFVDSKMHTALDWRKGFDTLKEALGLARCTYVSIPVINIRSIWRHKHSPDNFIKMYNLNQYSAVCFGEYRSIFLRTLASRLIVPVFFVDDGAASLRINRKDSSFKNVVLQQYFKFFRFDFNLKKRLNFFSAFALTDNVGRTDHLVTNDYSNLKSYFDIDYGSLKFLIIGQPLEELEIIPKNSIFFSMMVDYIINHYDVEPSAIAYVPHRRDSLLKIENIRKMGLNIIKFNLPLELVFPTLQVAYIISAYSSALFTAKIIKGQETICLAYDIRSYLTNKKHYTDLTRIYSDYRKFGIPTVPIENV